MPRRMVAAAAIAALAIAVGSTVTSAQPAPRPLPRIRFVAPPGGSIEVFGRYPKVQSSCRRPEQPVLRARYPGTVEVGRDREGRLFVIGVLPFESYLQGVAEVPRKWPMEALKAQVVAARSYALAVYDRPSEEGEALGYDLCATPACQVYAGMAVSHGPYGDRWLRAVLATSREVLLYREQPAETVYSSTSNGRTYGNDEVFGSDPLPYLRPVPERDDSSSPLSRWRVRIPLDDLRRFLRAGDDWSSGRIAAVRRTGGTILIRGQSGIERLDVDDFRSSVNYWAHCLEPNTYPTIDGGARLPQTIPSRWFQAETSGRALVLRGRGWGHGVGLVQWGAYGKAKRGLSYRQILSYYYDGLSPQPYPVPSVIRIGTAVGLKAVRVQGNVEIRVPRGRPPPGPWLVTGGKRLRVRHGSPPPDQIRRGYLVRVPDLLRPGRPFNVRLFVAQLSVVRLVLDTNGRHIGLSPEETKEPGTARVEGRVPTNIAAGRYAIRAVVTDGVDVLTTDPRPVRVTERGESAGTDPSPTAAGSPDFIVTPSPQPSSPSVAAVLGRVGIAVLAAAALITVAIVMLPSRRKPPRRR
ncbi:MAG: SpoIID/LytB domain-containing protein [Actinomycetota bacterium]|nr:SpoIID/LytB domain-containing protein [Actinomycetota bacterium]